MNLVSHTPFFPVPPDHEGAGVTYRDAFALAAMHALTSAGFETPSVIAAKAYAIADQMLKEREKAFHAIEETKGE